MTDLLDPPASRGRRTTTSPATSRSRSLTLASAVAGVAAAATLLAACMVVALIGWYASDAGAHGTTKDALRVGTDAWLMAHGAHLHLATGQVAVTLTAVPLGLTVLGLYLAHRWGRWAAAGSAVEDARSLAVGALVLAGMYGVVALVCAVLAATATATPSLPWSFLGGLLVGLVGGGSGLRGCGRDWRRRVPESLRACVLGAVAAALLLVAAGAVLATAMLLLDFDTAANLLSRLHVDAAGGLLYTVVVAAVAPNAALLSASYLLGPGFAVGTGTLVSPAVVTLGPVPAFPLLAALPPEGTPPAWLDALVAAPVAAAVLATVLVLRRHPALTYDVGLLRGAGTGLLGGVLVTGLVALAGGAVGPGRMTDVGAPLLDTLVSATVAMGVGGLFAGVAATWWARRR
jgi:hypothetical protein